MKRDTAKRIRAHIAEMALLRASAVPLGPRMWPAKIGGLAGWVPSEPPRSGPFLRAMTELEREEGRSGKP